ncbi:hypothetical protein [Neisseria leonii]|uniref:hypothetical protein n=1 Tax=Neisseria leonii TaxID=2995413 RepID=UPI00237C06FA|nr:hypothetical protein [Neisseria sp. 3986]MDD9325344.1 hypothetical protein [Neisseria sp. 3986]
MSKICIANTPLILPTPDGRQFRVETGEVTELTEVVAAHVTVAETTAADLAQQEDTSEDTENRQNPAGREAAEPASPPKTTRRRKAE